jgi:hypothetical protein
VLPFAFLLLIEPFLPFDWSGDFAEDSAEAAAILGIVAGVALRRAWEHLRPTQPARAADGFVEAPAHRRKIPVDLVRRLVSRKAIDDAIDLLRLRLDAFPRGLYQPVASLPLRVATRGRGTESRWNSIAPLVSELGVRDAVDIGANAGYFSIQLGSSGVRTIAIEGDPPIFRIALLAVRRSGLQNVAPLALELEPDNVELVPPADCVLFLSIWHHFVREYGLDAAGRMLAAIWDRTRKVMFFDTGEAEMPPSFGLPDMGGDSRAWLERYLAETCDGSTITYLGRHDAFDAAGNRCRRNLFAIVRG